MEIQHYVMYVVLFVILVAGLGTTVINNSEYGIPDNDSYLDPYDKSTEMKDLAEEIREDIDPDQTVETDSDFVAFIRGMGSAIRLVFKSFTYTKDIGTAIQNEFGIHPIFFLGFTTILLIFITFAIIMAYRRVS